MSSEANSSVTFNLLDPNGFPILLTFRDDVPSKLLESLPAKSKWLKDNGYNPQVKKSFGGGEKKPLDIVPDRKCPTCGKDLIYQTLSSGKKMIKCSTQKYDFQTKTTTGCEYKEWLD